MYHALLLYSPQCYPDHKHTVLFDKFNSANFYFVLQITEQKCPKGKHLVEKRLKSN